MYIHARIYIYTYVYIHTYIRTHILADASTEVKNLLNDDDIARLVREIDSSKDSHTALLDARSNPAVRVRVGVCDCCSVCCSVCVAVAVCVLQLQVVRCSCRRVLQPCRESPSGVCPYCSVCYSVCCRVCVAVAWCVLQLQTRAPTLL